MAKDNLINEMDLPLDSPNETLETISRNQFRPLFDTNKFEIRDEIFRDKGIDFTIEIKKAGKYTNFKFAVQLKTTNTIELNIDSSISLQLETSNINYLLNAGIPAFYVLYVQQTNTFFVENINDFVRRLLTKKVEWTKQPSHSLKFSKTLTENALKEMYHAAYQKGLFQREINEKLVIKSASVNAEDKILFDRNFNVTDDREIRELVENMGLNLINEARWKEILTVHKNASGAVASTAKYNLVLGIANYYSGRLVDALSFFKTAIKLETELPRDLKDHLHYFDITTRFSIGLIQHKDYTNKIQFFESENSIGLYVKLENIKREYFESIDVDADVSYEHLVSEINNLISDSKSDTNLELNARCEMMLIEGSKNNMDHVKRVALINAEESLTGTNIELRKKAALQYVQANSNWYKNVQSLKTRAIETSNNFVYFTTCVNEAKVMYELDAYTSSIAIHEKGSDISGEMPDKTALFSQIKENVESAFNFFEKVGHIENMLVALSVKYEFLHYLGDSSEAKIIMEKMGELIDAYDLSDQKKRLQHLKNNGTTHEKIQTFLKDILESVEEAKNEYNTLVGEMAQMDEEEEESNIVTGSLRIQLFPIGHFSFPPEKKGDVFGILNITNDARQQFDIMLTQGIIPVANIFHNPIMQEGYLEGNLADYGIENWRNIYRIRKVFFDQQFSRDRNL